ncbi:MAG: response regulator [Pedosphaera sp.]|nr:response regulator [Pedosphaera sp.]
MKAALIIDDDPILRAYIAQVLTQEGWRIFEAEDGEAGINLARQHRPEVVLCDLLMPRCNGYQVCRSIRAENSLRHTRIIVTSGRGYATDRLNALEAGADEYLVKPVQPADLQQLLRRISGNGSPVETVPAATAPQPVTVRFWGVRGSIPTPGPSTLFYGGNTSCVEVRADDEIIILDAGSGIRPLGLQLKKEFPTEPLNLTLLLTHTHWDHIQGFPFFLPAYSPKNRLRILGYEGARQGLGKTLSAQMESPYFPTGLEEVPASIEIEEQKEMAFTVGRIKVRAWFANHPGNCVGYRLETSAGSVVFLPDNEPFQGMRAKAAGNAAPGSVEFGRQEDEKLLEFIAGADVLIIDSQYDAAEYESHIGWGHACVDDVAALAAQARVKQLFLFHHDPSHDDEKISRMLAHARQLVAGLKSATTVEAAREGLTVVLTPAR